MNLECLNDIITDNLAIHIDLTDVKSWVDWNTGLTAFSLTKWSGAYSDNINLIDFGLTGFDNGRMDAMWTGITITPKDILFSMYRVGCNSVQNPTSGQTSGVTVTTNYFPMSATSATGGSLNYFALDGGYLQGFFKLHGFNYELLPARYGQGITIETILYLYPNSHGIFFMMGARAEDKYNLYFSGETITGTTNTTGVTTSFDNYLDAIAERQVLKPNFPYPESKYTSEFYIPDPLDNIKNNVIAFELTQDKHLGYKYVNGNGLVITNTSPITITNTGFTMISISFLPDDIITDPEILECTEQRKGKLTLFINGRSVWTIKDFPEFYCKPFNNDMEKQEGVPYSISWGGGSQGLGCSYHYDFQTYGLYTGQDNNYVSNNFIVRDIDDTINLTGLTLSTFDTGSGRVMTINYSGTTGESKAYFIRFNNPISILSNRDYDINLSIFNDNFFNVIDANGNMIYNKISFFLYSENVDIDVLNETEYIYPLSASDLIKLNGLTLGLDPFDPDRQEYQYLKDGILYFGDTGIPITNLFEYMYGFYRPNPATGQLIQGTIVSGEDDWKPMKMKFRTEDNTGQQFIYLGILIETSDGFNTGGTLYIDDFTYTGADILVQDETKNNLIIEQNFNSGFLGGIQKLRIYDKALNSTEIMHNALMEMRKNPALNLIISKGGRVIYT